MSEPTMLASASLDPPRRRALERLIDKLRHRLGERLMGVWLYGSRARGEPAHEDSDMDVMVVTTAAASDAELVDRLSWEAAVEQGLSPFSISVQIVDPEWVAERRRIESFFIREVDRDKIVVHGQA